MKIKLKKNKYIYSIFIFLLLIIISYILYKYVLIKNSTNNFTNNSNLYKLYCFWTGKNKMSEVRTKNLESLKNTELEVILITPDNLNKYIKEPLHEGYEYLSETHKADYLRTYFMHFYGGGYADIKLFKESWLPYMKKLENDNIWAIGYKEVPNGPAVLDDNKELSEKMKKDYKKLIGNCAYIFKPNTPITQEWYNTMIRKMDDKLNDLKKYPARNPQEIYSKEYPYPLKWTELLGNIFHPLVYKYTDHIDKSLPSPIINNYR